MRLIVCLLAIVAVASGATAAASSSSSSTTVSDFVEKNDGGVAFFIDDPRIGRVDAIKIELVTTDYAEFAYRDGSLVKSAVASTEAHCAYVGVAEGEKVVGVSFFSCGLRGSLIQVTFEDATVTELKRVDGTSASSMEGAYETRVWLTDVKNANFTASVAQSPLGILNEDAMSSATRRRRGRSLLDVSTANVLYFDYVFVSDNKRYSNYGNTSAVLADTITELLYVNQIYLVGDRFSKQIQFRIKQQIVWEEFPDQISPSNVGTGPFNDLGFPENAMDGTLLLKEFKSWIFETTFFDFARYLESGVAGARGIYDGFLVASSSDEYALGDTAHGWHVLTGEPSFAYSGEGEPLGIATVGSVCACHGHETWRSGCEVLMGAIDASESHTLEWETLQNGFSGTGQDGVELYCRPEYNVGISSTVNTPHHYFPGLILAHELAHNLGFNHVYNVGDQSGNVNSCMDDYAHNGSAILGYSNNDGYVSWSQCSVNKFVELLAGPTQLGETGQPGGLYSCAATVQDQKALPTSTFVGIPFAEGQEGYMHHVNNSYVTPSLTPATPTTPTPPASDGQVAIAYKLTIDTILSEDQNSAIRRAILKKNGVHDVAM